MFCDLVNELAKYEERLGLGDAAKVRLIDLAKRNAFEAWFVLDNDGKVVGYATTQPHVFTGSAQVALQLEDLYVKPDERRRGYGSKAVNALLEYCRQGGYVGLLWGTGIDNEIGRAFWEKKVGAKAMDYVYFLPASNSQTI